MMTSLVVAIRTLERQLIRKKQANDQTKEVNNNADMELKLAQKDDIIEELQEERERLLVLYYACYIISSY
jgi:hypothetical protein